MEIKEIIIVTNILKGQTLEEKIEVLRNKINEIIRELKRRCEK